MAVPGRRAELVFAFRIETQVGAPASSSDAVARGDLDGACRHCRCVSLGPSSTLVRKEIPQLGGRGIKAAGASAGEQKASARQLTPWVLLV
jgi:hypothetical protein